MRFIEAIQLGVTAFRADWKKRHSQLREPPSRHVLLDKLRTKNSAWGPLAASLFGCLVPVLLAVIYRDEMKIGALVPLIAIPWGLAFGLQHRISQLEQKLEAAADLLLINSTATPNSSDPNECQ